MKETPTTIRGPRGVLAAAFLAVALSAGPSNAQVDSERGAAPHEFIERPVEIPSPPRESRERGGPRSEAEQSRRPPSLTLARGGGELVLDPSGPVDGSGLRSPYGPLDPRSGGAVLDGETDEVGDLDYHPAFDPTVYPYKRGVARQSVRFRDGRIAFSSSFGRPGREPVRSDGPGADEDAFWGSFLLRADQGRLHPIPSVAPNQRLLAVETEPEVPVEVQSDAADNVFVAVSHDGLVRVNLRIAVPDFYFSGELGRSTDWGDFRRRGAVSLPEPVERRARRALEKVGVSRDSSPRRAVRRLVRFFRGFGVRPLPESARQGELLGELVERRVGVCRHRSMAFAVLVRRLGIPARYVYNEAHAFAEIHWPEGGWRRIDLGGAASGLAFGGERGRRIHTGSGQGSLPRPPGYRTSSEDSEEGGVADASSDDQRASEPSERRPEGENGGGRARRGEGPTRERRADQREARRGTRLTLQVESAEVYRGESVELTGHLRTDRSRPVGGAAVEVRLGRPGAPVETMERLGQGTTARDGRWSVAVEVPEKLDIGRWSLVAHFPGSEEYAPSEGR